MLIPRRIVNRELSWLAFNARVLQEADDERVPLLERIRFLAIFSSNLDEFFRVRVASLQNLLHLKEKTQERLDPSPRSLLREIYRRVERQQEEFGAIFRTKILRELAAHNVHLISDAEADTDTIDRLREDFRSDIEPHLGVVYLFAGPTPPFLHNRAIYLVVRLLPKDDAPRTLRHPLSDGVHDYALLTIPADKVSRFVPLPAPDGEHRLMMLDDVIRLFLPEIFPDHQAVGAWSVKLTRDADLQIDDEFTGDLLEKIRRGLQRRGSGTPSRFLFDMSIPKGLLKRLRAYFELVAEDLIPGGRYHNFNDFFSFPKLGLEEEEYPPMPPHPVPRFEKGNSLFAEIAEGDLMIHTPYQSFDYVVRFLDEAASDPAVESIAMTLYRVSENSPLVQALIRAAGRGVAVTAFVEVKARFDEESNLQRAAEMEAGGVHVVYSFPGLKVHAKLLLVERREGEELRRYGLFSSGNFNEKTARIYCDHLLFTADKRLLDEMGDIFSVLVGERKKVKSEHLLVAPFNMRERFLEMIDREIRAARKGGPAWIIVKLNSLEDAGMIEKLYEAGEAGVDVKIIARGICSLVPGVKRLSRRIEGVSIVDRFLEHARVYLFANGGDEAIYMASADWMGRNLDRRIEVAFPIYDEAIRRELRAILDLQLSDNVKARHLDEKGGNRYRPNEEDQPDVRSQTAIWEFLKE
jgi:polyphosphate kinase